MSAIDAHIAAFPPEVQARLQAVRATIRAQAPDASECISYGVPTFDLAGTHLVHFAGDARHIGFYPTSRPFQVFAEALAPYKCGKGSVQMRVAEVLAGSKK